MKRKLGIAMAVMFALGSAGIINIMAENTIKVVADGKEIEFEQAPFIEDGRTLIPFRAVAEVVGAEVDWEADTKTVICEKDGKTVKIEVGSKNIDSNGEKIEIDVPAKIVESRTFVPLRVISECLGSQVEWNGEEKTVIITTENADEEISKDFFINEKFEKNIEFDGNVVMNIYAEYPVFKGDDAAIKKINEQIKNNAVNKVETAYNENMDSAEFFAENSERGYSAECTYPFVKYDDGIVSVMMCDYFYAGGAHPTQFYYGEIYSLKTGEKMKASDFIDDPLNKVQIWIDKKRTESPEGVIFEPEIITLPEEDDLNFYIDGNEIVFIFNPYDIAPYAAGGFEYREEINFESDNEKKETATENIDNGSGKKKNNTSKENKSAFSMEKYVNDVKYKDITVFENSVEYPVFDGYDDLNEKLKEEALKLVDDVYADYSESAQEYNEMTANLEIGMKFENTVVYNVKSIDNGIAEIEIQTTWFDGGKEVEHRSETVLYDAVTAEKI